MRTESNVIRHRIVRTLLNHPEGSLTKYRMAKLSQSKFPTFHRVLKQLQMKGIIDGTRVKNYDQLFAIWRHWQVRPYVREYLLKDPIDILKRTKLRYGLTTYQAENLIQNYLFPSKTDFYIYPEDKIRWHKILTKHGLAGKGNTRVFVGDEHVFYNSFYRDGIMIISIPQLILDLFNEGGVGEEAAEKLMERVKTNALSTL